MKVELLHAEGCPGAEPSRVILEAVLEVLSPGTEVTDVLVASQPQAEELGFQGSPSIRVDGVALEGRPPKSTGMT